MALGYVLWRGRLLKKSVWGLDVDHSRCERFGAAESF
jgi:hypothetical protein